MKIIQNTICLGIGDNLVARLCLDTIKDQCQSIKISHSKNVLRDFRHNDPVYDGFMKQLGKLLFSEPPYQYVDQQFQGIHLPNLLKEYGTRPRKPNLDHLLCKGNSLILGSEYIVITTKIRGLKTANILPLSIQLWKVLRKLSEKYLIVIMGEKEIEMSGEYISQRALISCMYEQIVSNIPNDRIVDLTVPALGITTPNLSKIQQDCLIMKEAKFVLTLGIGGNVWLSAAVAPKTIGYREDGDWMTDLLVNPDFPSLSLTKNWGTFINMLESHL